MRRFLTPTKLNTTSVRELSQKFIKTHVPENLSDKSVNTQANRVRYADRNKEMNTSLGPRPNVEQQEKLFKKQVQESQLKPDAKNLYKYTMDRRYPIAKREADLKSQTVGRPQRVKGMTVGLDPNGDWNHLADTFKKGGKIFKKKTIKRKK